MNKVRSDPTVSVIIVSHNNVGDLRACLDSVFAAGVAEVIVVDNASQDGTRQLVKQSFPSVRVLAEPTNVGFATAANYGVASACGEYIALLNPDAVLHLGAVDALVAIVQRHPEIGIVGPLLLNADGTRQRSAYKFPSPLVLLGEQLGLHGLLRGIRSGPPGEKKMGSCAADWLKGAALVGRREIMRRFGPFDPTFFMFGEDIDLCLRLHASGLDVRLVPQAAVTHVGGQSTRRYEADMVLEFFRSTYRIYRKHYPSRTWQALLVVRTVAVLKALRALARLAWLALSASSAESSRSRRDLELWRRVFMLGQA